MKGNLFSESWFKVANLKVSLDIKSYIKKQVYRGEDWYIIEDRYNNQFFRIKPEAYEFISRLNHNKTIEEIWKEVLTIVGKNAPTQDEVITLLTDLHHRNLLHFKNKADNEALVLRAKKKKSSEIKNKILSFLYIKLPLFDPNNFFDTIKPISDRVFSKIGFIIWIIVLIFGMKYVLENISSIADNSLDFLSINNIFLLYISIFLLKFFHELGHGMMIKKFGGEVHSVGLMILVLTPMPFVDASSSWLMRSKYERALVGAAGIIVELFFASIGAIVWANTAQGLVNDIAFNVMVIGSVSSLIFNGNPLLKFDAYFILSDILEIPNLYERARKQWYYFIEKYIFKIKEFTPVATTEKEAFWLYLYGVLSFFYKLLISIAVIIYVANTWFMLGVIAAFVSFYMVVLMPVYKYFKYLFMSDKLRRYRLRVVSISTIFLSILLSILFIVPFPFSIKAKGVVMEKDYYQIFTQYGGYLISTNVENGDFVKKGDTIAVFDNKELELDIKQTLFTIKESEAYILKATNEQKADIEPIRKNLILLKEKLKYLQSKQNKLEIKSKINGYFIDEELKGKNGVWFKRGTKIGMIIPKKNYYFRAVVSQEDANYLFEKKISGGSIKVFSDVRNNIEATNIKIIPYQKQILPSAALGIDGGGDIAVVKNDSSGKKAIESFFEIDADIKDNKIKLFHGQKGILKIDLDSMSLFKRIQIAIKQLLQKRYQI